jgi:acyl-CoA thioesterase
VDGPTWEEFAARVAPARTLDLRLERADADGVAVVMPVTPELLQVEDRVHGGVLATLADTAAVYSLLAGLEDGRTLTSIEFKLNFLRPALAGRGDVVARARPVQRGRQIGLAEVELLQESRPVALGLFTYLVVTPRAG